VKAGTLDVVGGGEITSDAFATGNGGNVSVSVAGRLTINGTGTSFFTGISADAVQGSSGNAGDVTVTAGTLEILHNGEISGGTSGFGKGGEVSVKVLGRLTIDGVGSNQNFVTGITAEAASGSSGKAGDVTVTAGTLDVVGGGEIASDTFATGNGGNVSVRVTGPLTINGTGTSSFTGISAEAGSGSNGNAGDVTVTAGTLRVVVGGEIATDTFAIGNGGNVSVRVTGPLTINGTGTSSFTGISADADQGSSGKAGDVTVKAGTLDVVGGGEIASDTFARGNGGNVSVSVTGRLTINGTGTSAFTGISATADPGSSGHAGDVTVTAGTLDVVVAGAIMSDALATGNGGNVSVRVTGRLTIDSTGTSSFTGISARADQGSSGNAGDVTVTAGTLRVVGGGEITSDAFATGNGGDVSVSVTGKGAAALTIRTGGEIAAGTFGPGNGGRIEVDVAGRLTINGTGTSSFTGISATAESGSRGHAGDVTVKAGTLDVVGGGEILSDTFARGNGGNVSVSVTGRLTINGAGTSFSTGIFAAADPGSSGNAGDVTVAARTLDVVAGEIATDTVGSGRGGNVHIRVADRLTVNGEGSNFFTGIDSDTESIGNAGGVIVVAGTLEIFHNGEISSSTSGSGKGGDVSVKVRGRLTIDGVGSNQNFVTGIDSTADTGSTNNAGVVFVSAGALSIIDGGTISSSAIGVRGPSAASTGDAGKITVRVAGTLSIEGSRSGIRAVTDPGTIGNAGSINVRAAQIAIADGAAIASTTAGTGAGGAVDVTASGALLLDGAGTQIAASATPTAGGNAGSVTVVASQITLRDGPKIASTTAGTGAGGPVNVTARGALLLDGDGNSATQIAASAIGSQSGSGGNVTVAAGSLVVEGGAEIASTTAGPRPGGDVTVNAGSEIVLSGPGPPQITALSTGSGNAGSVTVATNRLLMSDGAAISTEAETSTANARNITLSIGDFLHLVNSEITTSVRDRTGNGGNINIASGLAVLDQSQIIAQAQEGNGGNITINKYAGAFVASTNSIVSASSQKGISGVVEINGVIPLNGALVALSSELRSAAALTANSCAARAGRPQSSLVEAGRGGLPQDPDASLPALYIAGRDIRLAPPPGAHRAEVGGDPRAGPRSAMRCD
jgi:large exoprotein involved in heme utilization and adhesion